MKKLKFLITYEAYGIKKQIIIEAESYQDADAQCLQLGFVIERNQII